MSVYVGLIPFDVAPVVVTLFRWQMTTVLLLTMGRYEARRRFFEHQRLSAFEQYRRHIQAGGYRP